MVRQSPNCSKSCNVVQNEPKYAMTLKRLKIYTKYSKTRLISWSKTSTNYEISDVDLHISFDYDVIHRERLKMFFSSKVYELTYKVKKGKIEDAVLYKVLY